MAERPVREFNRTREEVTCLALKGALLAAGSGGTATKPPASVCNLRMTPMVLGGRQQSIGNE